MHGQRLRLLLIVALVPALLRAEEEPIRLPDYSVSADVIAKMIPRDQLAQISREAAASTTFRFDELTMVKAPASVFPRPVKCLVRDERGVVVEDLTNDRLTVQVDPKWKTGFLSSNQPAEYSRFFLRLRAVPPSGNITIGFCRNLLQEYTAFSQRRLDAANRYYASGRALAADLVWYTVPDQVALVFQSNEAAADFARSIGLPPSGKLVRLDGDRIERLVTARGSSWLIAKVGDLQGVTPWAALAPNPDIRDGAALFPVGWVQYRKDPLDPGAYRFVAVALWFPK